MHTEARLKALVAQCTWVKSPEAALGVLPALATDLPPLLILAGQDRPRLPVRVVAELGTAALPVLGELAEAALRGDPREAVHNKTTADFQDDPLVPLLVEYLTQVADSGQRSGAVPAVALAWVAARMLGGRANEIRGMDATQVRRLNDLHKAFGELPSPERAQRFADVGWGLSGRLAAAGSIVHASGGQIEMGGLVREILTNPLALTFSRKALSGKNGLSLAAGALGLHLDAKLLDALPMAVAGGIGVSTGRSEAGKAEPVDEALRSLLQTHQIKPQDALFHPSVAPFVIAALPDLASAKELQGTGLGKDLAAAIVKRPAARSLAASWGDLCRAISRWDLLTALSDAVLPIRLEQSRWTGPRGPVPGDGLWHLVSPRPAAQTPDAAVVAVRLSQIRDGLQKEAQARGVPAFRRAIEGAWAKICKKHGVSGQVFLADHAVAVFDDIQTALAFAQAVQVQFAGPMEISVGAAGPPVVLGGEHKAAVGVAWGPVEGWSDGLHTQLHGATVARAITLTGNGSPTHIDDDALGIRNAALGMDGFASDGLVLGSAAVAEALRDVGSRGVTHHIRGQEPFVAGVQGEFQVYPFRGWWTDGTDVWATLEFGRQLEGGAAELLKFELSRFQELHHGDREAARMQQAAPSSPAPAYGGGGGYAGGFGFADEGGGAAEPSPFDADPVQTAPQAAAGGFGAAAAPAPTDDPFATLAHPTGEGVAPPDAFSGFSGAPEPAEPPSTAGFGFSEDPADQETAPQVPSDGIAPPMLMDAEPEAPQGWQQDGFDFGESVQPEAASITPPPAKRSSFEPDPDETSRLVLDPEFGNQQAEGEPDAGGAEPPEVSIEEDWDDDDLGADPWGGEPSGGPEGFASGDRPNPFASTDPSLPGHTGTAVRYDKDSASASQTGFAGFEDPEQPAVDAGGAGLGRTENLLELEAGDSDVGFSTRSAAGTGEAGKISDQVAEREGALLLEPEESAVGFERPSAESASSRSAVTAEIVRLFSGYVVIQEGGKFTFGIRDGHRLRDAHSFKTEGNEALAYHEFLEAKIGEGFVPRPDLVQALDGRDGASELDPEKVSEAYMAVVGT